MRAIRVEETARANAWHGAGGESVEELRRKPASWGRGSYKREELESWAVECLAHKRT